MRRYKRRYLAEQAAGLDTKDTAVRLRQARQRLAEYTAAVGNREDSSRIFVPGFGRSEAAKATSIAMNKEKIQLQLDLVNKELEQLRNDGIIRLKGTAVKPPPIPNNIWYNDHARAQMESRSISEEQALELTRNAILAISQRNGSQHSYYSEEGFVVIKKNGEISTVGWLDNGGKIVVEVMKRNGF